MRNPPRGEHGVAGGERELVLADAEGEPAVLDEKPLVLVVVDVQERPAAGDDLRGGRADRRAILAGGQRRLVFLLAVREHVGAVGAAHIAHPLAV